MLSYYQRKPPGWSSEGGGSRCRSTSPSKQKADHAAAADLPKPGTIITYTLVIVALASAAIVVSHRQSYNAHQQAIVAHQLMTNQQAKSLAATMEDSRNCRAAAVKTNKTLTAALQQSKVEAKKAQDSYRWLQDEYRAIKAAANKTLADFRYAKHQLDSTEKQLAAMQKEFQALKDQHAQDKYSLISPGDAGADDADHHQLAALADQVATPAAPLSDGGLGSREVVVVMCDAATTQPHDLIFPWCQAALLAGMNNTIVLAADMTCMLKAQEAGLQSLLYTYVKLPVITGQYAVQNAYAFQKYSALKALLRRGFAVLAAEPDMLLVGDPYKHMQGGPLTDMAVASDALDDDSLAYGRDEVHEDPASHQVYHSVHVAGLSPSLMHLKPNKACLEFVDAMLQGLQFGQNHEQFLMDQLLLTPSHAFSHTQPIQVTPGSAAGATEQSAMLQLSAPPRVRVLPVDKFPTSAALFGAQLRDEWLQRHEPAAIHVIHEADKALRMRAIVARYQGQPGALERLQPVVGSLAHHQGGYSALADMLQPVERVLEKLGLE